MYCPKKMLTHTHQAVLHTGKPANLYNSLYNRPGGGEMGEGRNMRRLLSVPSVDYFQARSWKNFFLTHHRRMPMDMRNMEPGRKDEKKRLTDWVRSNVPTKPP